MSEPLYVLGQGGVGGECVWTGDGFTSKWGPTWVRGRLRTNGRRGNGCECDTGIDGGSMDGRSRAVCVCVAAGVVKAAERGRGRGRGGGGDELGKVVEVVMMLWRECTPGLAE
jgi:hypothetical protein